MNLKVFCIDDADIHLSSIQSMLRLVKVPDYDIEIIGSAKNGKDGVDIIESGDKPDLVTMDIRMPVLDGISALVRLKKINPSIKVLMVSSEDEESMSKKRGGASDLPMFEKLQLLEKVSERVVSGNVEEGKINNMLDGCEELGIDPIAVAQHFGAIGYLKKPYTIEDTQLTIAEVLKGSSNFVVKQG